MHIEQIYTGCLAQGAYYIHANGEAAIIDPLRETQPYLDRLKKDNVSLKYIFETHFHADFVSGHLDLKNATNATIVYGPNAHCDFDCYSAKDGEIFSLGNVKIKVLHTPGHTMESTTFLLLDQNNREHCIFSGDTLFLGDVGRPDLAQKAANMSKEDLAALLYDSLYSKILPLPDHTIVYPGHGAGSACGKNMMKETVDSLGNQKKTNYALNQPSKALFIKAVLDGQAPPPAYFGMNVAMNKSGYQPFHNILKTGLNPLNPSDFKNLAQTSDALILDTRSHTDFAKGFIPHSINIGISGDFAPWVGTLVANVSQPILLVCDDNKEQECLTRLARVGFDNTLGFLLGGFQAWQNAGFQTLSINRISPDQFKQEWSKDAIVIDVRKESEHQTQHLINAANKPLALINEWTNTLPQHQPFYIHCAAGYRSMIAASILHARGFHNFKEIEGGFNAIAKTALPKTASSCQSSLTNP